MSLGEYLIGVLLFAVVLAGACYAAASVTRHLRPGIAGAERLLAWSVLGTAAVIAAYMVPGVLGVLNRWTPAIAAVLIAVAARAVSRSGALVRSADTSPLRQAVPARTGQKPKRAERIVGAVGVLAAAAGAVAYAIDHATTPVLQVDQITFHLPVVARWIQTGSLWGVYDFVPYLGHGNYPQNGEVLSLAAISPWRLDFIQRFVELPYFALGGVAVYALGRVLGATWTASALMGAVFVSIPIAILPSVAFALPDALMVATFGAGLFFLVRADYVLAGVALGLAFGAKWYGVSMVVAVVALWLVIELARRHSPRLVLRAGAVLGGLVLVVGGFWLVRNAIGSGSPFFPAGWLPIGAHPANALTRAEGRGPVDFTVAHYAFNFHVWRVYLLPALYDAFRWPGVLLSGALLLGAIALGVDGRRGKADRLGLLALGVTCLLVAVYAITPASAQGLEGAPVLAFANSRYLAPAALPAAAFAAWLCRRLGKWALVLELAAVAAILDGVHSALHFGWGAFAIACVALASLAGAAYAVRRAPRRVVVMILGALALVIVAGGQLVQTRYRRHRFADLDPSLTWIRQHAPSGARIGLTGFWSSAPPAPVYPSFGPRLRNEVKYIGDFRGGRLTRYTSGMRFVSGLRASGADLLIVGLGDPPVRHVPEQDWAQAAGYRVVTRSRWFALYKNPKAVLRRRPVDPR